MREAVPGLPRAAQSSLPSGVGFKSGCLLQGLKPFLIAAQQITLRSAGSLKAAAGVWTGRFGSCSSAHVALFCLIPALGFRTVGKEQPRRALWETFGFAQLLWGFSC